MCGPAMQMFPIMAATIVKAKLLDGKLVPGSRSFCRDVAMNRAVRKSLTKFEPTFRER